MSFTNVDYYERMKDLQGKQHESERKRLELEQQMNSIGKSDHRVAKLRAMRLQNYWKKVCEDEKRSQWRNEQLLKDFDRVESHMTTLSEKTDRLRVMKKQYEDYIERKYPNWKEKVIQYQKLKQRSEKDKLARQMEEHQHQAASAMSNAHANIGGYINLPDFQQQYRISSTLPPSRVPEQSGQAMYGAADHYQGCLNQSLQAPSGFQDAQYQGQHPQFGYDARPAQGPVTTAYSPNQPAQQPPSVPVQPQQHLSVPHLGQAISANSTMHTVSSLPSGGAYEETRKPAAPTVIHQVPQQPMYEADDESGEEVDEEPISPRKVTSPKDFVNAISPQAQSPDREEPEFVEDVSDFGSDDDLPLSDDKDSVPKPVPTPRSARGSISDHKIPQSVPDVDQSSVYTRPDVTLHGLFNLLGAVENELPNAFSPEEYYRTNEPAKSVKKEILSNAERGATLAHVEGASISMVVLEQIELNVLNSETGCMIPDSILFRPAAKPTEESIGEHVDAPITGFWEKMYDHFKMLLKHEIMTPQDIGQIFGPILIASDSPYEDNAKLLLQNLMENVSPDELMMSPQSTETFSTIPSPRKRESLKKKAEQQKKQEEEEEDNSRPEMDSTSETFPPLDLESDKEEPPPTALSLPAPATSTMPDLSQTAAYRQLLGETMSTQKTMSYEVSDESDSDDIEDQLGSVVSPRRQNSSQPDMPASSAAAKEPVQVPTEADADDDSKASTPSIGDTGGYLPSMGGTGKSGKSVTGSLSMASSGKSTKKPAYLMGDSDTEEDVEIPGTDDKAHEADFEFYG